MYKEITANKRQTWFLLTMFSLVVIGLFLGIGYASGIDPITAIIAGACFAVIYSFISFYTADKAVLLAQGAKKLHKKNAREIYLLVENLTIASGMPLPQIYLIDDPAPNAFATGRNPEQASIALTTGLLKIMNKQELEGVIAHELSHIKNYDIRLMTIIVLLVGLIALLADIGLRMGLVNNRQRKMPLPVILIAIVFAILSPIAAQVIKLTVSRSREYLADASGALLTRHPQGLASALEKIKKHSSKIQRANHATAHLFLASPFGASKDKKQSFFTKLTATHPPIDSRIKRLQSMGQ